MKRAAPFLITALIFSTLAFGAGHILGLKQRDHDTMSLVMHGGMAVDATELRRIVLAKGLTVYWLGPDAGTTYLLNTSLQNGISLRCIYSSSNSQSTGTVENYYEIGTFISPNAFSITQKAGTQPNGVGLTNPDGDAIYYDSRDPNNVYIGLKNAGIQIEIFDPRPGQALSAAMLQGNLKKIV